MIRVYETISINGEMFYAEIEPATPLIRYVGFKRSGWRYIWPFATGRTWKEPHIRWWYEVFSDHGHHIDFDGGGSTLRQTIWKASVATEAAVMAKEAREVGK